MKPPSPPSWTPAESSKPTPGTQVLVSILCTDDTPATRTYAIAIWSQKQNQWLDECGDKDQVEFMGYKVTHWIPLPDPPD